MRLGKYKSGTSENDIATLKQAVLALGVDAAAVISDSTTIALVERKGSGSGDYEKLAEYCDRQYSKGVLGQVLTTEPGKTGSLALGQVQNEVRHDLLKFDAKALARAIKFQIPAPMVYFNFGPDAPVPDFIFQVEAAENLEKVARVYSILHKDIGLPMSQAHIYDRFGVPVPEEGARLLPSPQPPQGLPAAGPAGAAHALPFPASLAKVISDQWPVISGKQGNAGVISPPLCRISWTA
ncbi:MAG: DUF935 family protein [bacterium]